MNTTTLIVVILAVGVVGVLLGMYVASVRTARTKQLREHFGPEYDRTVQAAGGEKKALGELEQRQKHVEALNIQPLTPEKGKHYLSEWANVQARFVDEPGQAILDADRLIMEVMQLRRYPVSNFEQRAADISVNYPNLVNNYRAAHAIALKHENSQATTEDLRQAMIYYRSLFEEMLEVERTPT
jgi:hypothetical protein